MSTGVRMNSFSTQPASQFHQQILLTRGVSMCNQNASEQSGSDNRWIDAKPVSLGSGAPPIFPALGADISQSIASIPYSYSDPPLGSILTPYGSLAAVNPMMVGSTVQVPLPLPSSMDRPIYVNPKQYHAILRRRELRAKQEAQNKVPKVRKPYLHESRHVHAMKRQRGSGGRFLNTTNNQEQKQPVSPSDVKNTVEPSSDLRSEPEVFLVKENNKISATPTSSEITNASDEGMVFQQQGHLGFPDFHIHVMRLNMRT